MAILGFRNNSYKMGRLWFQILTIRSVFWDEENGFHINWVFLLKRVDYGFRFSHFVLFLASPIWVSYQIGSYSKICWLWFQILTYCFWNYLFGIHIKWVPLSLTFS